MFSPARRVAFVEDDEDLRLATVQVLELAGLEVQPFASAVRALATIDAGFPGVVVTDIRMPQMDGRRLFHRIREIDPEIPVILITGHADVTEAVEAMHAGAYDFVAKPFTSERLVRPILNALEKRRLVMDNRTLRLIADEAQNDWPLIGQSPPIEQLRQRLRELARVDLDTLIEGETGVGKELAAHALHTGGPRRGRPFVAVDCAALPADLAESELFGHERGAFPGALRRRTGRLEAADRGTLFLDNIQAMPTSAQAKLLRFLDERQITPLGSNEPRSLNVRVVAASKTPLEPGAALIPELFHRLNVARIVIPPLRERRSDVPLLFAHFLARASARFSKEPPPISDGVRRRLIEYDWPGNVREVAHFAERVLLDLEPGEAQDGPAQGVGLRERIDQFEADLIREALRIADGDIRKTIAALSVPRKTFYDKAQRHRIDLNAYRPRRRRPAR